MSESRKFTFDPLTFVPLVLEPFTFVPLTLEPFTFVPLTLIKNHFNPPYLPIINSATIVARRYRGCEVDHILAGSILRRGGYSARIECMYRPNDANFEPGLGPVALALRLAGAR